ncbi:co-chaperone DjlA [Shewanella saliphila]|uniref:Co-chaperone protein DjlA n=1 Tax=Shewanella saliphila TaxID=2282698 RepID=A0ABQ2Q9K5_9GAMM|nr:co-chaperone DjlA [Shewanella saliphila]MCL1100620.1 co-chaperone DjlA [Shewanella saliphila]GGP61702.1 co-chaperone protein DjlA [Shewanella saliphila]
MRIWGKVFGFIIGFMFGRFFGAFLGLWLGHAYDKRQGLASLMRKGSERQAIFFNATFAVMGHMAKASGRVTENDIRIATMLMDQMKLTGQSRIDAQKAFRHGRQADFDLAKELEQFRHVTQGRAELSQMFLEIQIQTALSDGELHANEKHILSIIANKLGMASQLDALLARWQAEFSHHQSPQGNKMPLTDAYVMLGLADSASDQDIKRAYRKLMNEHHPDKLVAKGLPEEMMALAKTKAQDIQAAYECIKTSRGMR